LTERSPGTDAVTASIAKQVRALRQARGWSLDELALRSGVSKGMVVQVEGVRTNPSIGTLCRLAEAFGVHVGRLLEAAAEPVVKVVTPDEQPVLWKGELGGTGRLLRGVNDPAFVEVWEWRFEPGERHASSDHSPSTRELVTVHSGVLTVLVHGGTHQVGPGETIDFRSDRPHEYRNEGTESVLITMVVVMPSGEYHRGRP
jgi:transcriptional regulator with XRE-family HTH domain